MRVKINAETLDPIGEPEHVSVGRMAEDFCINESAGVAYLTTHRENTIDCVSLDPAKNSYCFIVAGDPSGFRSIQAPRKGYFDQIKEGRMVLVKDS